MSSFFNVFVRYLIAVSNHAAVYAAELHPVQSCLSDTAVCSVKIPEFLVCEDYYISEVVLLPTLRPFPQDQRKGCPPPRQWLVRCFFPYTLWETQLDRWTCTWGKSAKNLSPYGSLLSLPEREKNTCEKTQQYFQIHNLLRGQMFLKRLSEVSMLW